MSKVGSRDYARLRKNVHGHGGRLGIPAENIYEGRGNESGASVCSLRSREPEKSSRKVKN